MNYDSNFIFRLPQTVIRAFGIKSINDFSLFQTPAVRNYDSSVRHHVQIQDAIKDINKTLLAACGNYNSINGINLEVPQSSLPESALIDSNLINESNSEMSLFKIKSISVLPYSSFVYNPKVNELVKINQFSRCLLESLRLRKLLDIYGIYDWTSMILKNQDRNYLPWFWKPLNLQLDLYEKRIVKSIELLMPFSFFLNEFVVEKSPIYIQATQSLLDRSIQEVLSELYVNSKTFKSLIDKKESRIFLKQHRNDFIQNLKIPLNFRGIEIISAKTALDFLLPAELFINSNKEISFLASEWSSTIFNYRSSNLYPIKSNNNSLERQGLTLSRSRKFLDYTSFSIK